LFEIGDTESSPDGELTTDKLTTDNITAAMIEAGVVTQQ